MINATPILVTAREKGNSPGITISSRIVATIGVQQLIPQPKTIIDNRMWVCGYSFVKY